LALEGNGMVYSWGNGQGGRLGHGDETGENLPKEIKYFRLQSIKVMIIEAGESNSAVITSKNELLIWGIGLHGRLGTGKTNNVYSPSFLDDM
jgi:alpha-tubulin suppressor-like RCC1 family protein